MAKKSRAGRSDEPEPVARRRALGGGPGAAPATSPETLRFAVRFAARETVALKRAIWSESLGRRVDPPASIVVDGATADWLVETARASRASASAASISLESDARIPWANANAGERYWDTLWLAQRSSLHEEDAPRTFVHADRRLLLRFVHRAKASETLGVVVRAEVATTDPDYPAERHVRRTFDLVAAGEGDARASALLRDSQRLGSIAGRIAEARRALEPLSRMPEHGETAALVDEVESVHREHVGPRGQLPAGVARLLSTKLDLVHERIVGMLRRREARGAREQAAAVRALGNAVSAERRRGARPSKPFNKPICDAYRAIKDKGYEPHQIVSILVKREWERAPTRTGGKPERKQLKRRTIDEILVAEGVKEKREK